MTTVALSCRTCDTEIRKKGSRGRAPMYCSLACRKRDYRGSSDHLLVCATCSTPFTSRNPKSKYCSPVCREPDNSNRCSTDGCDRPHRARGLCSMCWKRTYGKRTKYLIACVVCGQDHHSDRADGKYCSDACKGVAHAERGAGPCTKIPRSHPAHPQWVGRLLPARYSPASTRRRLPVATPRSIRQCWYSGRCQRCSTWFLVDQPANRYCSRQCYRADAKARRRALKRDAFVAAVYRRRVFERDKWRCGLCGKPTKRDAVVPHPLSPVLDHIIPLAKGGTHEPSNVQCAHFTCNSLKGDRGGGEQLMLIG